MAGQKFQIIKSKGMAGRGLGKIPNRLSMVPLEMCDVDVVARPV